ncbi:glutaredoxin-like protein [Buchnera aphidicola (Nipponaphis monzeni)]|uniref:Glutaredoxin n=1 Tax=Buchnera aphidicola (Nipponaphis monzeni) TaxID=2495405 RepID=A0A455TA03_9GAMM|nr:Grx4 family monothiol glutaredoxin [Buchnera aphidicola]BBI01166.1 glutaredoxin-like protein [Buchnera aphidicola (Nipponaphis monzeni)]
MTTLNKIKLQISQNSILIYMKGTPESPNCGFSAQAVKAIASCGKRFAYVDVLKNIDIRTELPKYSNWPTFPQLWINGELIGGCDIIVKMFKNGQLQEKIDSVVINNKDNII